MDIKPEFAGIYLLYRESVLAAWRAMTTLLVIVAGLLVIVVVMKEYELRDIKGSIADGNSIVCEMGYLAKIVEDDRVTCIMIRDIGVGAITHKLYIKRKKK